MKIDLIKRLAMGAFVGCFIGLLVAVFISLQAGPQNINFSGTDIINLFFGCLHWMPITLGIGPIITWILIACVFAAIFWCGFYIYYYLLARNLNKKIVSK